MTAPVSRELEAAARAFADANSARIAEATGSRRVYATITSVAPGTARDGNAVVKVSWHGAEVTVNGYDRAYTPVVGHRVVCDLIDNQLSIDYSVIGAP